MQVTIVHITTMYLLAALQYGDPTIVRKPAAPVPRPRKAYVQRQQLQY